MFIMKKSMYGYTVILISLWTQPAMAYIDPGSGSAIMSAIIGAFVALGLAIKTYWYKLKSILSKPKKKDTQGPESE